MFHQHKSATIKLKALALATAAALAIGSLSAQAQDATPLINAMQSEDGTPSLAPMLKNVIPGVVNISVKGTKAVNVGPLFNIPEEFRFMFPDLGRKQNRQFRALGSGVIIDADKGYIVTNHHVIDGADQIRVALSDGREFDAKKIGSDPHTDLTLLKLEKFSDLTEIKLADSDSLEVGDFAVAIGNPFGLGQTVTSGIISALGRTGLNIENIENFIQTDAAINSGNSGGALVNLKGELVGINTAILGPNGGNIGIGFAIPSNMVKTVTAQLEKFGEVRRGQLGILGQELNPDLAQNFGYKSNDGAFVNEVNKGSAADKAGIKPGDIIFSVDGKKVTSFGELRARIATIGAGNTVNLGIFRDGKEITLKVKLDTPQELSSADSGSLSEAFAGASFANAEGGGVEVTAVDKRSAAYAIGLREGDVITAVNRSRVKDLNALKKLVKDSSGRINALRIERNGTTVYITFR